MKQFFRMSKLVLIFVMMLLALWSMNNAVAEEDAVEAKFQVEWANKDTPLGLTSSNNSPNGARRPKMAVAPNGNSVIVVFNHQESAASNDNDPYFVRSNNNGGQWSVPAPIFTSADNSIQPSVSFDELNKAHAVWVENENKIYYSQQDTWPVAFTQVSDDPGANMITSVDSPKIVATSSNILDVIWVQQSGGGATPSPNIVHARSTDGGASWTVHDTVLATTATALAPDMFVFGDSIYLVWQEEDLSTLTPPRPFRIMFNRSLDGGNSWLPAPREISDVSASRSAERPSIVRKNGRLEVIFTNKSIGTAPENLEDQAINFVHCTNNCSDSDGWSNKTNISGPFVGANSLNSEVVFSSLTSLGDCSIAAFHGTLAGLQDNNEIIFNTVNCDNGGWSVRQEITASNIRSLRPVLATQGNFVYLAYTEGGESSSNDRIRFLRGELEEIVELPMLYLPVISNGN